MPSKTNEPKKGKIKETKKNEINLNKTEKKEIVKKTSPATDKKSIVKKSTKTNKESVLISTNNTEKKADVLANKIAKKEVVKDKNTSDKKAISSKKSKSIGISSEKEALKKSNNKLKKEIIKEEISPQLKNQNKKETNILPQKTTSAKKIAVKVAETLKVASQKILGTKSNKEKAEINLSKSKSNKKEEKISISKEVASSDKKSKKEIPVEEKTISKTTSSKKPKTVSKPTSNKSTKELSKGKTTLKRVSKNEKSKRKSSSKNPVTIIENYNLPYRYNETIVKILYQTPNTLFVYWDISDKDRENFITQYGENFFDITYPVLIIHNDTMNYSFEVIINDFANSWYLRVNDSKCNYRVELGRKVMNYYNIQEETIENYATSNTESKTNNQLNITQKKYHSDYIYVTTSNAVELPNDHILFKTDANNTIKYRNVKTKQETNISIYDIIKNLPLIEKTEIPYLSNEILEGLYTAIYKNEDLSVLETLANPSSGGLLSSRMPHS